MTGYLKRLLSSLGAYQVADACAKLVAILLLPIYTGKIDPNGYGIVETLMTFVIFVSILVRFGIIESFLRYHFIDASPERRDQLARRCVLFLLATSSVACIVLLIPAAPLSKLVTANPRPIVGPYRVAILGVWAFTNLELAQALLRVDERLRAYATVTLANVGLTIVSSLVLVVGFGRGYEGMLIGNYGSSTVVLLGLWWSERARLAPRAATVRHDTGSSAHDNAGSRGIPGRVGAVDAPADDSLRTLMRFGLPTVPAEASVYALSVLDRQFIIHQQGQAAAGRYAIAIKVAAAILFIVRAFQYAWPPLAYSVTDDAEAGRLYGLVATYYTLVTGFVVAALTLEARYIVRYLAPHAGYFDAYRAIPWVCLGWALYGLWVVFLVIAGRAHVTRRNFPAAIVGLLVNVVLLLVLIPRYGIAGGGVALCGAYVGMLGVMYLLVRRVFPVPFEWRRLAHLVIVIGGITVAGDLLLPTHGAGGLLLRAVAILLIPIALLLTGFLHPPELRAAAAFARRLRTGAGAAATDDTGQAI